MTAGKETLAMLEAVGTRKEGIFVMPKECIPMLSTYFRQGAGTGGRNAGIGGAENPEQALKDLEGRYRAQPVELQRVRAKCLPGH